MVLPTLRVPSKPIAREAGSSPSSEAANSTAVLEAQNLSFRLPDGGKLIFDRINLTANRDKFVAIVGPTGSGKSTLLHTLAHLNVPTSGRILLHGAEILRPSPEVALIHQSIATFPWMTALDNVKFVLVGGSDRLDDNEATEKAHKMLEMVGLKGAERQYPKEMSGGMRQRVAIARALAGSPKVLLLDEPFVHLDEITGNEIRREVYDLVSDDRTTLESAVMVSHNLRGVVQAADRVYVLGRSPATVTQVFDIDLPRPRSERNPRFLDYVDQLAGCLSAHGGGPAKW